MNRSDLYGCSSYWRNNHVQKIDRPNSLKKYMVILPMVFMSFFFPSTIDVSSAKLPEKPVSFFSQRKQSLEEQLDKILDGDISRHNLISYVDSKVKELIDSEGSKKELEKTLSKLSAYDDYILQASRETGLDTNFIKAYLAQESMGNPEAESEKGAKGLGGMRKCAAEEVELKVDKYIDERLDLKAILGSARYMKEKCIDRFNDYVIGLIAYNAGPTWTSENLKNILKSYDIIKNLNIPFQSRDYVVQVLAKMQIFSNTEFYNLQVHQKPLVSQSIRGEHLTKKDVTLKTLANIYKVKVNDLKRVNPSIKSYVIPKGTTVNIPDYS